MINTSVLYDDKIIWKKDRLLRWGDFKGIPDPSKEQATAESGVGMDENHELEYIQTSYKRKFKFKKFVVEACFVPSKSWVKNDRILESDHSIILKHEQGHFDICEKYARILQERLNAELLNKSYSIKGKNETEIKKNAEEFADEKVSRIMNEVKKEWQDEQMQYEHDTENGRKLDIQKEYDLRFSSLRDQNLDT